MANGAPLSISFLPPWHKISITTRIALITREEGAQGRPAGRDSLEEGTFSKGGRHDRDSVERAGKGRKGIESQNHNHNHKIQDSPCWPSLPRRDSW